MSLAVAAGRSGAYRLPNHREDVLLGCKASMNGEAVYLRPRERATKGLKEAEKGSEW